VLGWSRLPDLVEGDERLETFLSTDGPDLLVRMSWSRPMTPGEVRISHPLEPSIGQLAESDETGIVTAHRDEPWVVVIGPNRLDLRAWSASDMHPLEGRPEGHMLNGNLSMWFSGTDHRLRGPVGPGCIEVTFNEQTVRWRIPPLMPPR